MAIVLQIYFQVEASAADQFEVLYATRYAPALQQQDGYEESRLLRIFDTATSTEISATTTRFNYQMELQFSSEQARRAWVKSNEHKDVWPLAEALAISTEWCGYHLVANDSYSLEAGDEG